MLSSGRYSGNFLSIPSWTARKSISLTLTSKRQMVYPNHTMMGHQVCCFVFVVLIKNDLVLSWNAFELPCGHLGNSPPFFSCITLPGLIVVFTSTYGILFPHRFWSIFRPIPTWFVRCSVWVVSALSRQCILGKFDVPAWYSTVLPVQYSSVHRGMQCTCYELSLNM